MLLPISTLGYTDSGLAAGTTYGYSVIALDAAGNASAAAAASAKTLTLDTTPPTAPGNLKATVKPRKVALTWTASTDNVGVAGYRAYRNGVLIATVAAGSLSYTDGSAPKGADSYTVAAYDAAGNKSPLSNTATVVV